MNIKIKRYFTILREYKINYYRVIHGIKTAFACLLGLALENHYQWPMGQWVPITIMVVMSAQRHFGGAVRKASMRLLGTVSGVIAAVAVLWLFGDNTAVVFITIFFASIIFVYMATSHGDISYAGTLGGVTVILVMAGRTDIEIAIQRGCYITLGIIIALLVSRFVFPVHARDRLRYHVATTLRNLSKLYSSAIQSQVNIDPGEERKIAKLSSKVAADIAAQHRLIYEAVVGSREFAAKKNFFTAIIGGENSLSRLLNLLFISLQEASSPTVVKEQLAVVEELHDTVGMAMNHLADSFEFSEGPDETIIDLEHALTKIEQAVPGLPKEDDANQLIIEHSFLFFMEQILKELENMRKLIVKVNSKNRRNMV